MRLILALALLLVLPACDPAAPGGAATGSHTTRVVGTSALGPIDQTIEGRALFAVQLVDGVRRLVIQLQSPAAERVEILSLTAVGEAIPPPGVYPGTAPPEGAEGQLTTDFTRGQQSPFFFEQFRGEAGTVTITSASASRIEGSLDLTLRTGAYSVRAAGTFTATPGR